MKEKKKTAFIIAGLLLVSLLVLLVVKGIADMRVRQKEEDAQEKNAQEENVQKEPQFTNDNEAEITAEIQKRYGNVRFCGMEGELYRYDTGEFTFCVQNDQNLSDNYEMEYFRYLTDTYFSGRNRAHDYEKSGSGIQETYLPVVSINSSSNEEKEWFCGDVINWLLYVKEKMPYKEEGCIYKTIGISFGTERFTYEFENLNTLTEESISAAYNEIYEFIDEKMLEADRGKTVEKEEVGASVDVSALSGETVEYYLSLEPECTDTKEGVEYRMVGVDRACGSSYYALIGVDDKNKLVMVNADPYLGSGGAAKWLTFLKDGQTGFSCLAYSGGSYGSLYRTEDGGKSFEEVQYPSPKIKLPDGTYYNPFVMPERVYEEGDVLYMEAGQGAEGDYYGENGFASGLYESKDRGKTWSYVGEFPETVW